MQHSVTFLLQNGALWDIRLVRCGICELDLLWLQWNPASRAVGHGESHA